MGSFLNLNFIFESDKDTFNGSPRYCHRGPLYNYVISKCHYTENLETTKKNDILFFEVTRGELEFKRILKVHKDWIVNNNVNVILANIADPSPQEGFDRLYNLVYKSELKNYVHFIDSNTALESYYKTYTFDYFIEEIINYDEKIEGELFGYGSKNDLGYISKKIEESDIDNFRNKKFLSFNRVIAPKYHRSKIFFDSFRFNLHKDSYFSFLQDTGYTNADGISFVGWDYFNYLIEDKQYSKEFVQECASKLPIKLDTDKWKGSYDEFRTHNTFKSELFLDSCINIVTETSFQFNEIFLSEKILKPIVMYQPFIVLSGAFYLKRLKEIGFKTFDEFWDESYDLIEDFQKRYDKILLLILELNSKSIEELNDLYKRLKDICIYNRNHLINMKKNSWPEIFSKIDDSTYKRTTQNQKKGLI